MAHPLSPPQLRSAIADAKGFLTGVWPQWFEVLWTRIPRHGRVSTGSIAPGARGTVVVTWAPAYPDTNFSVATSLENAATSSSSTSYDMLDWMLMRADLRAANHLEGTKLDLTTPSNHIFTQLGTGNFYWVKGDSGYPWDINIFDDTYIYLSTTERTYGSASEGKRFESLTGSIGLKGVPFAKRSMSIGDSVLSKDSRLAIYTACGVATYTDIGNVKVTLTGPYTETIPGAGGNLPANLATIHLEYEWSLDTSYNHKSGSVKETYTLARPYGLVRWQSQAWNVGNGSYDAPSDQSNFNILTAGTSGLPASDPCGLGTNGGGSSTLTAVAQSGAGLRIERILSKAGGSVTVQVINDSGVALSGTVDAIAVHD